MTEKQKEDRDKQLVKEVIDWHDSELPRTEQVSVFFARLSEKYKIVERTIYQILEENSDSILSHKNHEKLKRILRLKREIALQERSKKDVADLLDQLRIEIEGNKIEHSGKIEGGGVKIILITPQERQLITSVKRVEV
jgi:predicted phage-related endonuclease